MKEISHSIIKRINRKKIISLLIGKEEITKLDISRELGLSITTVSTNINELKEEGLVQDVRSLESTGGRKAMAIELCKNSRYSLGIAVTPKLIKISLLNLKMDVVMKREVPHNNDGINVIISIIKDQIDNIRMKYFIDEKNLLGLGISIPGTVDSESGLIKYCYLLNIKDYNLKDEFKYLNVPVFIDNEANLSAYYEYLSKKEVVDNLLYVSITDGLGLGVIIDKEIYRGSHNSSGEMGHTKIAINGKRCNCGAYGCLEAYTSKNALIDEYNDIASDSIYDIKEFENKCNSNDMHSKTVLNNYINILAIGISNLIMLFDTDVIVIGGDINSLIKGKINELNEKVKKEISYINNANVDIYLSKYKEAYLLGAAMLPIQEYLK